MPDKDDGCFWSKKTLRFIIMLLLSLLALGSTHAVHAKKPVLKWVESNGQIYYYDSQGKKARGLYKIRKEYYYFSKKGEQRTGWREIDGNYYYFRTVNKAGGYMLKNTRVNGIRLKKNGKAKVTSGNYRKLKLMVRCSDLADSLTNAGQPKAGKLKTIFLHVREYPYRNLGDFRENEKWDLYYAEFMLDHGCGDCFCFAYLFGYLANAIGYQDITFVSSEGHGWIEMGDRVYDPQYSTQIEIEKCYNVPISLSGAGGRINYRKYGFFKRKISQ